MARGDRMRFRLKQTVSQLRKYRHIMAVLMKYGFDEVVDIFRRRLIIRLGSRAIPSQVKRAVDGQSRPHRFRLVLEELGPTFIKLGQLLSTRPDLVPQAYIDELSALQDRVAPAPLSRVRTELEAQLGAPIEERFREFHPRPLAAASIAQVYRAVTLEGDAVVVKVRRPGIVQTIQTECKILEELAGLVRAVLPPDDPLDPVRMVREFTEAVSREVDLTYEARSLRRFSRNFADDPTVRIPKVYSDYSSEGVLTLEHIRGIKCSDLPALRAAGLDPKLIAERGARFILRQVFDFGFFHADPHPGNVFVLPGNVLAPVDFGQVARLSESDRRLVGELVLAVTEADAGRVVRAFQRADIIDEQTDTAHLTRDLEEMIDRYASLPLKEVPVGQVIGQSFDLMRRHRLHPPGQFTLMLKSLMTIESVARNLDGDFQLIRHFRPYARRLAMQRLNPRRLWRAGRRAASELGELALNVPGQINTILTSLRRGKLQIHVRHEHLENLAHTLDRSSNRVAFGLIIAGTVVASSLLVTQPEGGILGMISFQTLGILGYLTAAFFGFWLLISILKSRKM